MSAHQRIAARQEAERLARLAMKAQELAQDCRFIEPDLRDIYEAAHSKLLDAAFDEAGRYGPTPWPWLEEIIQTEIIDVAGLFGGSR